MEKARILLHDGSFNGFLTAVFHAYGERLIVSDIQSTHNAQNGLFSDTETIFTDVAKAKRVWNAIEAKSKTIIKTIYFAYLSEHRGIDMLLYRHIRRIFGAQRISGTDYSDEATLKINQLARSVGREKHRMEAFVRFQLTKDGIYFANIEPDFNVMPLISRHFRSRYADQQWLIYDVRRKYGLFYNLGTVEIVTLDLPKPYANSLLESDRFVEGEYGYQTLWNDYFKSTHIKSRINQKLHIQHVPKRYWKYLSEKKQAV